MFTEQPIDCLTDNKVESLRVGLIEQFFDNRRYEINSQNSDFNDLTFYGNDMLICYMTIISYKWYYHI